jgi:hypothetical protein
MPRSPNLYDRAGYSTPEDVAAKVRAIALQLQPPQPIDIGGSMNVTCDGGCQNNSVRNELPQEMLSSVAQLSNAELVARVKHLTAREQEAMASLIAHLAELDKRRLYFAECCSSMFTYCTQVLHLSEHAAYGRIEAARAARRFPLLLERLGEGSVNLTTVGLLTAHLTPENHREVLDMARHKSKRQVEEFVARLRPQPPVPSTVRRLPTASPTLVAPTVSPDAAASPEPAGDARDVASPDVPYPATAPPPARPAVVAPLAPQRYKVQFTASAETYEKIRIAQNLLRHQIPDGDPAKIFDRALSALLRDLAKQKIAATDRPGTSRSTAPGSRHIPAEVKRAVWMRDGGRCAFVGSHGRRCTEQGFLEFHHVAPHADGGEPTADNIHLRCRAHNSYEAELHFGPREAPVVREARAPYSVRTEFMRHPCRVYWRQERGWDFVAPQKLVLTYQDYLKMPDDRTRKEMYAYDIWT